MSLLSQIGDLEAAWKAWGQYGPTAEKALAIVRQIDAIDKGGLIGEIEKVLLANGIDAAAMIASLGGTIDLTSIKGVQNALNVLGCSPPLIADGSMGNDAASPTWAAIAAFQAANGLRSWGGPDDATVAVIRAKLAAR